MNKSLIETPAEVFPLKIHSHQDQAAGWPSSGRHIMAQADSDSIVVYQAYRPSIADFAVQHQRFGGDFSFNRMSWIKPNFLWMMYRSGWAAKEGQERILAIRLKLPFFDKLLRQAVVSSFDASRHASHEVWKAAVAGSEVRLQWDPDHDPQGKPLERRAVQLGLRGGMLQRFGGDELLTVHDITGFVHKQRQCLESEPERLMVPVEKIYRPADLPAAQSIGID